MANRLFERFNSSFTNSNSQRARNFSRTEHLLFAAVLDGQLLELEKRHTNQTCAPPDPQQRISDTLPADPQTTERCSFDDFGLVEGLEIDVSWM